MENKLQTLTDKLYQEGLRKGQEEGDRLLQEARSQAEKTLEDAKEQACRILENAKKESEDLKKNAVTEITITSRQMLSKLKQEMEECLMSKTMAPAVHSAFEPKEFVQNLILKTVEGFNPARGTELSLEVLLPEADRKSFDEFIKGGLSQVLKGGLDVRFSGDLQSGFKIVDKGQGYMLSFTEEDFMALFKEYARPRIKQLLFA